MNPFFVDLFPPVKSRLGKRASGESGRDLLIKAVGLPNRCMSDVTIYDLTAGFGQDSLLMAKIGARQVYMVERNPIVACLLKDALRRLVLLSEASCIRDSIRREAFDLANRLHLIHDDGLNVAKAVLTADIESRPEIIYLDPMFPERKKSASVKKNMQILHKLLGCQDVELGERLKQEHELLLLSLEATRQRVVVKRPKNAPELGRESSSAHSYALPNPMYGLDGPVCRWDVYVK
ncbi:16S rRNA (guanine1516-N2)-methyltransferase [Fistulifera solaris]|uniref:16S rRNA (Guanine1516-N2)-methyltransferase n=1 Tax=Fistulifera solaris TaxID=1519565 RepID=A0A1Z5KC58_FISSO|nr:16S rRNA (guanine1516-N2)-methyltransferase [Fistulifera solaris]|eukprot:GAX23735.1 16S rRNA (guanine1516-N2)-methyltransferase [Fistulifera solaris]